MALNTLVFENSRIKGSNTDGWGFLENLRSSGVDPATGPALILGAGGSTRAIAAALLDLGVNVTIGHRTWARATPRRTFGPRCDQLGRPQYRVPSTHC